MKREKRLFWILGVSLTVSLSSANQAFGQGANLVKNPGFEDDRDHDGKPDGWTGWRGKGTPRFKLRDGGHTGKKAMTVECTEGDWGELTLTVNLKVKPHTDYTLSFWHKMSRRDFKKIACAFAGTTIKIDASKTDWTKAVVTRNSGEKTELNLGFFINRRNNTLWIDDVMVVAGKTEAPAVKDDVAPEKEVTGTLAAGDVLRRKFNLEVSVSQQGNTLRIDDVRIVGDKPEPAPLQEDVSKEAAKKEEKAAPPPPVQQESGAEHIISSFETVDELRKWSSEAAKPPIQFSLSEEHVTKGKFSCKGVFPPGKWPTMAMEGLPVGDWSGYEYFAYDIYNSQDFRLHIAVTMHDRTKQTSKWFWVSPKTTVRFQFAIREIRKKIDITQVNKIGFEFFGIKQQTVVFVDNLQLISKGLTTISPKGLIQDDNSPTFRWKPLSRKRSYRLQYATDPAFPVATTITVNGLFADSYTPPEPLANGKWYWRVRALETPEVILPESYEYSKAFSFDIVVPAGTDKTPPILTMLSEDVMAGLRPALKVGYRDDRHGSGMDLNSVRLHIDGKDVTAAAKIGAERLEFQAASDYQPGKLYAARLTAGDKAGNQSELSWTFRCYPPPVRVRLRKDNTIMVDGKPMFPFGFYGVVDVREDDIAEVGKAGFNIAHLYAGRGQSKGAKKDARWHYLDVMNKHGQKMALSIPYIGSGDPEAIRRNILAYKDHPGIISWYTFDEPDGSGIDPLKMLPDYQMVKKMSALPTSIVFDDPGRFERYVDVVDIFWTDPYPTFFWGKPGRLRKISDFITAAVNVVENRKPVWVVPLSIYSDRLSKKVSRAPTFEEERAQTYLGIVYGARGVVYFAYNMRQDAVVGWRRLWAGMKCMATNIRRLNPILLSTSLPHEVRIGPRDCGIAAMLKEYQDQRYLIAVNGDHKGVEATFTIPGLKTEKIYDLTQGRWLEVKDGSFRDAFKGYDVHIYSTSSSPQLITTEEILAACEQAQALADQRNHANVALIWKGADATASHVSGGFTRDHLSYSGPLNAIDDNLQTPWSPGKKVQQPWIEVSLPGKHTVDRVVVVAGYTFFGLLHPDNYDNPEQLQLRAYNLQYRQGDVWKTIAQVTNNTERIITHRFKPVVADRFRLVIIEGRRVTSIEIYGSPLKTKGSDGSKPPKKAINVQTRKYEVVDRVSFGEKHWSATSGDWNSDEGDTDNSFGDHQGSGSLGKWTKILNLEGKEFGLQFNNAYIQWMFASPQAGEYRLIINAGVDTDRRASVSYRSGDEWIRLGEMKGKGGSRWYQKVAFDYTITVPAGQPKTAFKVEYSGKEGRIFYLLDAKLQR